MTLHMDAKYQARLQDILQGSSNHDDLDAGLEYFHERNTREGILWMLMAFDRFLPRLFSKIPDKLFFMVC